MQLVLREVLKVFDVAQRARERVRDTKGRSALRAVLNARQQRSRPRVAFHAELNDPADRRIGPRTAGEERIVQVAVVELIFAAAVHAVGRHRQPAPDLTLEAEADALRLRRLRALGDDGLAWRDGTERTARERLGIARIL